MDTPNEENNDITDEGIFMKMPQHQESVASLYAPVPMTPTQTESRNFVEPKASPQTPDSPNYSAVNKLKVQSDMKRITSAGNMQLCEKEAKVLVLYTGGTIGMLRNEKNGEIL